MDVALLSFRIQIAVAENHIRAGRERRVFRTSGDVREKRIPDIADNEPDDLGTAGHQATSEAIGPVMKSGRHLQHPLPRRRIHTVRPAQGSRSCRDRDAGRRRYVAQFGNEAPDFDSFLQSFPIIRMR